MHKKQYFLGLSILLLFFSLPLNSLYNIHESVAANNRFEKYFHLNGRQEIELMQKAVGNEAIVQTSCHLFANSTSNITLVIKPEAEWNVSRVMVGIGQNIAFTITNGEVITPPSDVAAGYYLWIYLEPEIAEVWGEVVVIIVSLGWTPVPWFLLPGFLSLLLFGVIYSWKRRKK